MRNIFLFNSTQAMEKLVETFFDNVPIKSVYYYFLNENTNTLSVRLE